MIVTTQQSTLSFGTDPVACAVRDTLRTVTMQNAGRRDRVDANASGALDINRLYPNLSVMAERPGVLEVAVRRLTVAAASLRHAIASF